MSCLAAHQIINYDVKFASPPLNTPSRNSGPSAIIWLSDSETMPDNALSLIFSPPYGYAVYVLVPVLFRQPENVAADSAASPNALPIVSLNPTQSYSRFTELFSK